MNNENMGPFISKHLIMKLVTSNPTPAYVARVATIFNNNGKGIKGDLKATLRAILLDDEARGVDAPTNFGKIDNGMTAFTHFASRLNAKGVSNNQFIFKWLGLSQLPMTAPTPFGFYTMEDAPVDEYFSLNNLVAPELTYWDADNLKGFLKGTGFNYIHGQFDEYATIELKRPARWSLLEYTNNWDEYISKLNRGVGLRYDLSDIYTYYIEMSKTVTDDTKRMDNLYNFVAIKFLGEKLPEQYLNILQDNANHNDTHTRVQTAIQRIVNTSHFIIIE